MQIQPLASILSDTSTATDPFNDVSSGNSPKPDHTTTPFDDLQLFIGIGYKHTRYDCLLNLDLRIYSTVDDFVLLGDRNRVLYYDSTNFTLNKIVELPNVSYIMQHHVIQNFLIILTKCQRLLIIDAFSGLFFTEIELFQPFVSFQEIISLDDCGFNILLKANGSFCQIVTFDLHSHRLLLKSSIIYPRFRPVYSLSIQDTFFYLFDKHGDYQVVIINGNNYHLLEATPNKNIFLDASFGLLRSIERLSPGKIIFLQDKGFSVFELRCTEKVSLNSLELFMYSLLPFSYSKFIQIQGIGYILMNGGYLMQIRENNTIVIKPEGRLLDIIPSDNFVLGIFEHYGKVARCLIGLEWSASTAAPIVIQENRPVYQDEKMVISYEKDNFVFRDQKGNEIITISSISETLKVVDLSPILQHDSSPYYYILVDHKGVVRFLVYNLTINPHFIKCIDIGNFDTDTILSLSYWEDTKTIEFRSTDEEKILNLRSLELIPRQKNLGSRLLIFKSRCLDIPALEEFFEKAVSVAEQLTLTNKWVIAQENNMNVFQRFTSEGSLNSPELMLLCKIYNKSHVDFHSISLVENVQRPISLVLRLGQLFGSSEQLIVDYAMYLVSEILVSLPSVLPLIVSIICSRKLTTRSSILLMLCFSICPEIVPANKALYLIKCAYLLLLKNQRAMKKVALDALKVLSRKDFRGKYDRFELAQAIQWLFVSRDVLFKEKEVDNIADFQSLNMIIDGIMIDESLSMTVTIATIFKSEKFDIDSKTSALDYINYFMLEKSNLL